MPLFFGGPSTPTFNIFNGYWCPPGGRFRLQENTRKGKKRWIEGRGVSPSPLPWVPPTQIPTGTLCGVKRALRWVSAENSTFCPSSPKMGVLVKMGLFARQNRWPPEGFGSFWMAFFEPLASGDSKNAKVVPVKSPPQQLPKPVEEICQKRPKKGQKGPRMVISYSVPNILKGG